MMFGRLFKKREVILKYKGTRENEELPVYKYHENAITSGIITKKRIVCQCCNKLSEYCIEQPLYTEEDVENLCPWCVADGKAAKKYDGIFIDLHDSEKVEDSEIINEITLRNLSYPSWQENVWVVHCNDYCKYVDSVEWEDITELQDELSEDLSRIAQEFDFEKSELIDRMKNDHSLVVHLFECIHCGKHRIHAEWD